MHIQIIYIPSMYWIYVWIVIPQVFVYFFPFTKLSNKQHKCCYNWSLSLVFGNTVKLCCSIFILFMIFHANTALHTLSVLISSHLVWWFDWLAIIFKTRKLTYRDRWFYEYCIITIMVIYVSHCVAMSHILFFPITFQY